MFDFLRRYGTTSIPAVWKYGKVRCIILDDLKYTEPDTYAFIKKISRLQGYFVRWLRKGFLRRYG